MKSRKQAPVKAGGGKKKVPSDVCPSTSLPPLVEGQLRCFLRVNISQVLWTVHKPPSATFVRLRWWGESSSGTHFFPKDGSQPSQKTTKTTACFPIRCCPKQFTSYLSDMGSLVLEVVRKPDHLPIARAHVSGISCLSLSHPISGFYTLVSPASEKMGDLQVSLALEPLTEAYESSGSGPVADISIDGPQVSTTTLPTQPRSQGSGSGKKSPGCSSGSTPRGKDDLYFQSGQKDKGTDESLENRMPITKTSQKRQIARNPSSEEHCGQSMNDILSVILERGNKLRNAMVVSALNCETDPAPALKDAPYPLQKDNIQPPSQRSPSPSGMFLQNILVADSTPKHSDAVAVDTGWIPDCLSDMDNRAVELLLGSLNTSPLPPWNGESMSGHSSVCGDSELNDPQYDESLLESLFYKTPMSDARPDDTEVVRETAILSKSRSKTSGKGKHLRRSQQKNGFNPEQTPDVDAIPLSAEQLSLLSSVRLAKVTINSMSVPTCRATTSLRETSNKRKPLRPLVSKKCTFFVEYAFPTASTSSRHGHSMAADGEVTRVVSSKIVGEVVKFHHQSTFPVNLTETTVEQWWGADLLFKIFSRKMNQKKPALIGTAVLPLQCLLQSEQLTQSVTLTVQTVEGSPEMQESGTLKVSLELTTDDKDFSEASKKELSWRDASASHTIISPQREPSSISQHVNIGWDEFPTHDSSLIAPSQQKPLRVPSPRPDPYTNPHNSWQQVEEDPQVLLHTLLMVPNGKNFNCGPMQAPNVYLNCKLLWCDETARSVVSWGQANPSFNFAQVTPVTLTTKLLERMKNNMMVIEVWQKMGSSGQDRLLGLVKLPLHQFYTSFRDPKIAHLLLQAQYPVLGVDCYMPVIDVFSGSCKGSLRVVLAVGRMEQILNLQRMRDEENDSSGHLVRPVHLLDYQPHTQTKMSAAQDQTMREHLFVIRVEKVNGLTPLQSTVWGEADCYIQYSFPCQEGDPAAKADAALAETSVKLKSFRTTTTLCVPVPEFDHTETHVLVVPDGVPVQRLLLSSLSTQGLSNGGGIQFEVWCRYYYPNVRDQLVAKGMLPLSKLCAMVTMQRLHPDEAQMFSLPLVPRTDSLPGRQPQPSGLLDVCLRYKHRLVRPERQTSRGAASRIVTLVVKVHRASGLQAAARSLSEQDERFSYFATVGVNAFVSMQLSFLPESERRCTRVAARTFCPEFDHHMEVACDLLAQRSSGETSSLAEILEEASAVFTIWNIDNRKAHTSKPKDVMLGSLKIPLADLIHKRTGISGWFGVYGPQEISSSGDQCVLVGGLEISVNFAHHSDRERVIKAAQGLGWEMPQGDDEAWEDSMRKISLTFAVPRAWIPVHCLLLPGHSELQRSTYCYFRYKFYDQDAVCSRMKHPSVMEGGEDSQATVHFEDSQTVELMSTQPLMWYLQDERLEVEVWVAFKKDKIQRPSNTDRLVGSAFIDLSSLTKTHKQKLTLSGVYPLFSRWATNLQGAALRVHLTLTSGCVQRDRPALYDNQVDSDSQEEHLPEEMDATALPTPPTIPKQSCTQSIHLEKSPGVSPDIAYSQQIETSAEECFPMSITVEQAMHVNLKGCPQAECSKGKPCCSVSYITADSAEPVSTAFIADTDCPVWDHHHECRLSKQLLVDPQESLVFKVWHKGEMERVIGYASVDLSPLVCGFQSVCGWYNITDYNGQCHGQLKVSITPLKWVQDLRLQRKAAIDAACKNSPVLLHTCPLSYHTTATYSSFPSHISRYPEQKISTPDHMETLFSGKCSRSSESDRHHEHMDKVRLYHESLQEQTESHSVCSNGGGGDMNPSSSILFSALRKKLSELDNIQRYFSQKLSSPTCPSTREQHCYDKQEERRGSETDRCWLPLQSTQLVGEVNNLIYGLRGQHLETIPSNPQSSSSASPVGDRDPHAFSERISTARKASISPQECTSPPQSPVQKIPDDQLDSEVEEEKMRRHHPATVTEDENAERTDDDDDECRLECRSEEEAEDDDDGDEEEDEDYEEVVVKPRHLNEVTSLTDKTSPWTSVLSDPDLVSLESMEEPEQVDPDPSQYEGDKSQLRSQTEKHGCALSEECPSYHTDCFSGSTSDSSYTGEDVGRSLDSEEKGKRKEPNSTNMEPDSSSTAEHATVTHDASCSADSRDTQLPPLVPNFFLQSHHLEASLKALRLGPSFSQSSSDTEQSPAVNSVPRQGPRRHPSMSPTSMKKKTERIAKIIATHFDEAR